MSYTTLPTMSEEPTCMMTCHAFRTFKIGGTWNFTECPLIKSSKSYISIAISLNLLPDLCLNPQNNAEITGSS